MKLNTLLLSMSCAALTLPLFAQNTRMETFCNPLNVDYTYMIYNSDKDISYRSGADPAVVEFRGEVLYVCHSFTWLLAFYRFAKLEFYSGSCQLVSAGM